VEGFSDGGLSAIWEYGNLKTIVRFYANAGGEPLFWPEFFWTWNSFLATMDEEAIPLPSLDAWSEEALLAWWASQGAVLMGQVSNTTNTPDSETPNQLFSDDLRVVWAQFEAQSHNAPPHGSPAEPHAPAPETRANPDGTLADAVIPPHASHGDAPDIHPNERTPVEAPPAGRPSLHAQLQAARNHEQPTAWRTNRR
jgi:hypothetical protein